MSTLDRWLGGSPVAVLIKLVVLSLVVGVILAFMGLTPIGLVHFLLDTFQAVFGLGYDAIENVGRYVFTGAIIVIPLWLISRLMNSRR